jgi:hypothetical protein
MPDGRYLTPEEEQLNRMLSETDSPEQAGADLLRRLEALEQMAARLVQEAEAASAVGAEDSNVADAT